MNGGLCSNKDFIWVIWRCLKYHFFYNCYEMIKGWNECYGELREAYVVSKIWSLRTFVPCNFPEAGFFTPPPPTQYWYWIRLWDVKKKNIYIYIYIWIFRKGTGIQNLNKGRTEIITAIWLDKMSELKFQWFNLIKRHIGHT
jgi:hypothetical protein